MKKSIILFVAVIAVVFASCKGGEKVNLIDQDTTMSNEAKSSTDEKSKEVDKIKVNLIEDENSLSNKVIILADPYEFSEQIEGPVQLVDVRTPEEYSGGRISNATNMDFNASDFEDKIQTMDKEKMIFIYCKSGNRSGQAALKMKELGFKKIYDLEGGYDEWKKLGL